MMVTADQNDFMAQPSTRPSSQPGSGHPHPRGRHDKSQWLSECSLISRRRGIPQRVQTAPAGARMAPRTAGGADRRRDHPAAARVRRSTSAPGRSPQAAGVAEGTIFGVFPDKSSLLVAALMQALDPQPTLEAIAAIDPARTCGSGWPRRPSWSTSGSPRTRS